MAPGASSCRLLSCFWPGPGTGLEHQAGGPAVADERLLPAGQIQSRSVAIAAFHRSCNCDVAARSPGLARAVDADDALREVLRRGFAADILSRRSAGARKP